MTDAVKIALIVAMPPTIAAVASIVVSLLNRRGIAQVHTMINSELEKWIKSATAQARLEGAATERADERERQNQSRQ